MKAWVVDDEDPARRRLSRMLSAIEGVQVVAELEDAESVLKALELAEPDVIFLDVRMPGLDGVSLAQKLPQLQNIVFVTAYDAYAVRAFEVDAVDYLLKPVRPERLSMTIERVRARDSTVRARQARPAPQDVPRVVSAGRGLLRFFDARSVTRFWSSDKYTAFVADGAEQLTEESLSALEARLIEHGFVRVHRGELVRSDAIRSLRLCSGVHEVELTDGQTARVSRRFLQSIKQVLGVSAGSGV